MAVLHPEILYAQRSSATEEEKNIIYFTIQAPDIQGEPELRIEPTKISFKAKAGDKAKGVPEKEYAFEIELYDEIVPEQCKKSITSRAVVLILRKKAVQAEFWPRLTKEKVKNMWIKTDFSKWVDEDEQEGAAGIDESEFSGAGGGMPGGMGGMDMASMMGGMGGMGGMPGMGGMGGMPGMGGMGGMPGMGGMGGAGGMDFAKMMEQMGQGGAGAGGFGDDSDDDLPDGDDDEEAPAAPVAGETAPTGEAASEKLD